MASRQLKNRGGLSSGGLPKNVNKSTRSRAMSQNSSLNLTPNPSPRTANSSTPTTTSINPNNITNCATCNQIVGDDSIGCDRCENWFCPTSMCVGLPDQLIDGIRNFGGDAVAYKCTECRAGASGSSSINPGFNQLLQTVKKLCETVQSLSNKVANLTKPPELSVPPVAPY